MYVVPSSESQVPHFPFSFACTIIVSLLAFWSQKMWKVARNPKQYRLQMIYHKRKYRCCLTFWFFWFINQRALYNHALSIVRHRRWCHWCSLCRHLIATGLNRETSYFVYICTNAPPPLYIHIKYLVIRTCSFQMVDILVLFFLLSCPCRQP